jgi:hypothetical protein
MTRKVQRLADSYNKNFFPAELIEALALWGIETVEDLSSATSKSKHSMLQLLNGKFFYKPQLYELLSLNARALGCVLFPDKDATHWNPLLVKTFRGERFDIQQYLKDYAQAAQQKRVRDGEEPSQQSAYFNGLVVYPIKGLEHFPAPVKVEVVIRSRKRTSAASNMPAPCPVAQPGQPCLVRKGKNGRF